MFDSRAQPFDSWWNTLTDDQRRQAHDSIGREVNANLRESFVAAEILLIDAELSDDDGGPRHVWLMPTDVTDFITSTWAIQSRAPDSEQFRINARRILDEFATDHETPQVDVSVNGFTTDTSPGDHDPQTYPSVHGNTGRVRTGVAGHSFDLPTYE